MVTFNGYFSDRERCGGVARCLNPTPEKPRNSVAELTPDIAADVLKACQADPAETGGALSRTLDTTIEVTRRYLDPSIAYPQVSAVKVLPKLDLDLDVANSATGHEGGDRDQTSRSAAEEASTEMVVEKLAVPLDGTLNLYQPDDDGNGRAGK